MRKWVLWLWMGLLASAPAWGEELPDARVVIPWKDFQTLYERGQAPPERPPPAAPRDYAISRVVYTGEIVDDAAVFKATVQLEVFKKDGWTTIPLLPTSVALRRAKLGRGGEAPIYLEGNTYRLITNQSGPLTLELEFAVATFSSSGQQGFSFQMAPAGATEVELVVPSSADLDFEVANAQRLTTEARGDRRVLRALLPSTGNLAVSWQRASSTEAAAQAALEPRIYAEHQALVGVGEGLLQCNSVIHYSILQAGVEELLLDLPAEVTVLEVQGQGIREWAVEERGGRDVVRVDLNFEARGAYTLQVEYEQPLAEDSTTAAVPDLRVIGADRVKGFIGIDARSNLEIDAGTVEDARPVDVRELPAGILGQTDFPVLLGFRYNKARYKIPLELRQHEEVDMLVTIIDRAEAQTVITPDGRRMTKVTWAMRNNRAQFLRLDMPEGAIPWSTFVGGRSVKPARGADGRVLVPLARSQSSGGELSRFAVEMVYVEDAPPPSGGRGTYAASLPVADVPSTAVAWTVFVPDGTKVKKRTIDGSLRRVDSFTPIQVPSAGSAAAAQQAQVSAAATFDAEAAAAGVQPVRVSLPIDGEPWNFEKLLVLSEELTISFDYRYKQP